MLSTRAGRTRTVLLTAGVLLTLGLGGYVLSRSSWVRAKFAHDADNPDEIAKLGDAKLSVEPLADPTVGWPQWRGPKRDGRAPAGPLRTDWDKIPPKPRWSVPCGGGYSSLAVVGGKVYAHDRTAGGERVMCLDATTGSKLWEYPYAADYSGFRMGYATGPRATPTVVGNRVYAVGAMGRFLCLESPPDGGQPHLLWEHDLLGEFGASMPSWGVSCSPLVESGVVIVQPGGKNGSVVAFDSSTGEVRWKAGANPGGYSSPVAATVGGVRLIYALTGDAFLCIRASDGEVMGRYDWKTDNFGNIATPVVIDDYVFISSAYNKGCALLRVVPTGDRVTLEEVYARSNRVLRSHHSTPVYRDGFLYGFDGTRDTILKCVDFRKGTDAPGWADCDMRSGTLILADKYLVILTEKGNLALVEATPDEYRLVASVPSGLSGSEIWSAPVLVDGQLYLRGSDKILCLDVRP
jgi:outer membrane protein assembly factor BamB